MSPNYFWLWVSLVFGERGTSNTWNLRAQPAHLYAQQVMALALQERGIAISDLDDWLGATFEAVSRTTRRILLII